MSLMEDLEQEFVSIPGILHIDIDKNATHYGEPAIKVGVLLNTQNFVEGIFTKESRPGFGGVDFAKRKEIPKLMKSKIEAVLAGKAEV